MESKDVIQEWSVNSTLDNRPPDTIICIGTCHFHTHKDVLVDSCDYFKAMFSSSMLENAQDVITIKLVDKCTFEILLEGFYSGHLSLTLENVFEVTLAAHVLQVSDTHYKQCCDFMKSVITPIKCFEILHFSQFHNLQHVYDASRRYCIVNFSTLCKENSFLNLTCDQVVSYLSDEFLVAEGDFAKVLAFCEWCEFNDFGDAEIIQKAVVKIMSHTNASLHLCEQIAQKISKQEKLDDFLSCLSTTMVNQDLMMFWTRLSDSAGEGLVDVIKLSDLSDCNNDWRGVKIDTMTEIVMKPGFDLGSAVCGKGQYVYVCGGGPNFGRMDWIRDIWRYSLFEDNHRWTPIGKLPHPLRYHAMVPVGTKLYVFGGFGKFRAKNCNLESFDISSGEWSQHACVPTWEIKPVATYYHQTVFYVSCDWNIHAYNTSSNGWTLIQTDDLIHNVNTDPSEPFNPTKLRSPLSCFVWPSKPDQPNASFVVLSQGSCFQTHYFKMCMESKSFHCVEPLRKHNVDMKTHTYLGACVFGNRIIIFFMKRSGKEDDTDSSDGQKENECTPILVMYFTPESGELKEGFQINNIVKAQSIVAVPVIPKTFSIPP